VVEDSRGVILHFRLKIYVKKIFFLLLLSIATFSYSRSQEDDSTNEQTFLEKLLPYFPPAFFEAELELKDFIRSDYFLYIKHTNGELASIDSIFVQAKNLTNENLALALLLSTLATNDHRILHFRLPIFNLQFPFPLTFETEEEFHQRFENLPRYFLSKHDNRDKLQHFFASAFLSYSFESKEVVQRFGIFVEEGERGFISEGTYDDEDLRMNSRGAIFGSALKKNAKQFPSMFTQLKEK